MKNKELRVVRLNMLDYALLLSRSSPPSPPVRISISLHCEYVASCAAFTTMARTTVGVHPCSGRCINQNRYREEIDDSQDQKNHQIIISAGALYEYKF